MDAAAISAELGRAYDDYFALSDVLRADMEAALEQDFALVPARRNFLRVSWTWIEGYVESLRRITVTIQPHTEVTPTAAQRRLIQGERLGACDSAKECLKLAYAVFEIKDAPDFSDESWLHVQTANERRDRIAHPKTVEDLNLPDEIWGQCCAGTIWIMEQLIGFHTKMLEIRRVGS